MGNLESIRKMAGNQPQVIIHPNDAAKYNVTNGANVKITSSTGTIRRQAIVSTDAREGVLVALGQWWPKFAPDKKSLNELTSQRLTDLGGGSTFGNPVVRVEC
jgi:anaerobic selenocysteine-containing dehydrogenase